MKFVSLFKKELREMVTIQTLFILVAIYLGTTMLGKVLQQQVDKITKESSQIVICDMDDTPFTQSVIALMKNPGKDEKGEVITNEVKIIKLESEDYAAEAKRLDEKSFIVIPKGFTDQVNSAKTAEYIYVNRMTSLSTLGNTSVGSETAKSLINTSVVAALYADKQSKGKLSVEEIAQLNDPVEIKEKTVVADVTADIASSKVISVKTMENMFLPIIVFLLLMYSSQMVLNAVSTEKIDKTLETLLSAPVSRLSVLASKMLAAAIVSATYAIVMMFGMSNMMSNVTQGADTEGTKQAIESLGLTLSGGQFILVGLQMFMSLLIALSISMVLGVLAKDAKSGQALMLPIQLLSMVPYMLSMFVDVKTLSPIVKYIVYAIPFSHTFMANENLMFNNMSLYWGGLAYQFVLLVICMTFAIKVFTSDRIFTMTLGGAKKSSGGLAALMGKKTEHHEE